MKSLVALVALFISVCASMAQPAPSRIYIGRFYGDGSGVTNVVGTGGGGGNQTNLTLIVNGGGVLISSVTNSGITTFTIAGLTNPAPITLSIAGGNVAVSAATPTGCIPLAALTHRLTETQAVTISNPSGGIDGQRGVLELYQDGTGGWATSWGTNWKVVRELGGSTAALGINTVASKWTRLSWTYHSTDGYYWIEGISSQP